MDLPQQVTAGELLLGIGSDGSRLLVPLAPDVHRSLRTRDEQSGSDLAAAQLEQKEAIVGSSTSSVSADELRWLFSSFVADILLRFERHPEVEPPTIVRTCYSAWRGLFAGTGRG